MDKSTRITNWLIRGIEAGDNEALGEAFHRYYDQLLRLVEHRINPKFKVRFDGSDVLATSFRTFVRRTKSGLIELTGEEHLLPLLAVVVQKKLLKKLEFEQAAKRTPDREQPGNELLDLIGGEAPTVDEGLRLNEIIIETREKIGPSGYDVLNMVVQGYTPKEIVDVLDDVTMYLVDKTRKALKETLESYIEE